MSWKKTDIEHLRMEFVWIASEPGVSVSEVCRQFNISRKTGYKWRYRFQTEGAAGLAVRTSGTAFARTGVSSLAARMYT
jgi:transposase-like protein